MNPSKLVRFDFLNQKFFERLFFIFLLIFSLFYAKERIINSDAGFYLFKLINFGHFNIEHGRYSAFLSQIIILAAIKAGLSLNALVYIYSASFVLLFWMIYLLIKNIFKNQAAALALIMLISIGIAHSLYRPEPESTQGLVYALLLFAVLFHPFERLQPVGRNIVKVTLSFFIILLCFFAHPITIFPILFIIAFYTIERTAWKTYLPWLLGVFTILLWGAKVILTKDASYEGDKLSGLDILNRNIPHFFSLYSTQYILRRIYKLYLLSSIIYIFLNIFYLRRREYLKCILLNVFVLGFVFVHNLIYYNGGSDIEMDKNLMTANFFLFLPFAFDIFYRRELNTRQRGMIMTVFLIFSMVMILHPSKIYTNRTKYYKSMNERLQTLDGSKFYTEADHISKDSVLFLWGVPFESLLISSLDGPDHSKTIYPFSENYPLPTDITDPELYICVFFWPRWNVHELNRKYFRLPAEPYRYIDYENGKPKSE